jgi:hypothetical protein
MLYDILVRATALLAEIESTPVSGTTFKAAEDIPEAMQDFEAYIAFMSNPSHTQDSIAPRQFPNVVIFPGLLVGAQILTGNPFTNRAALLQYADLIGAKFNERFLLHNAAMQPLAGVTEAIFRGGRVFEAPYPGGQSQINRHQYSFTLEVKYNRFRTQSH